MVADAPRTPFSSLAEGYERIAVPAMFIPAARNLLEIAALEPGECVLDVACGTGTVARLAAPLVGETGHVTGLDLNEAMLAVARAQTMSGGAPIEWRQGNAMSSPSRMPCSVKTACSLCRIGLWRFAKCCACCDPIGGWC